MSNPRKAFEKAVSREAALRDGPVGRYLEKVWNDLHDIEYDLQRTDEDYDDAAHFVDGPARKDAQAMLKKINEAVKEVKNITSKTFTDLVDAEAKFVKEFGDPAEYSDQMRREIFPR